MLSSSWILQRKRICVEQQDVSVSSNAADGLGDKAIKIGEGTFAVVYRGQSVIMVWMRLIVRD